MARALQPDEFRDVLQVLAEDVALAFRDDRNVAQPEGEQLLAAAGIVRHVDDDVVYLLFRKKLFRSEAAASPRLEKQDELFGWCVHVAIRALRGKEDRCRQAYYPLRPSVKPERSRGFMNVGPVSGSAML